ncbi:MAG: hypothetical protein QXP66_00915 [Candidatus Aenigmatarchaeota archaeon]
MKFLEYIKEFRQWLITIIIIFLAAIISWQIRSCGMSDIINQKNQLEQEKEQLKSELEKLKNDLNRPPETREIIKYKEKIIQKCFETINGKLQEIKCDAHHIPTEITITKEDCCKLGIGCYITSEFFFAIDENICVKGDERIGFTEKGKKQFGKIIKRLEDLGKPDIFRFSLLGGYDAVPSYFVFGVQFINLYGFGFIFDISSDLRYFSDIRAGIAGIYRPEFWSVTTNIGLGIGASSPIKEFGKKYMLQAMILFYIVDF